MKHHIISSLVATVFLLSACGGNGNDTPANSNDSPEPKAETALGAKVYKANCKLCHGSDGKLGLSGAANLSISALSAEETLDVIRNGRNTMQAYKDELSEEEIVAVAEYIEQFK